MTYPIQPEPSFWSAEIGEATKHFPLSQNFFVQDRRLTVCSSKAAAALTQWRKLSNLWTPCIYSLRPRVPSWIWIWWIQYSTHRNNFTSPPKLAMSTAMQNSALTPSYFISGQHFLKTFMLLLKTNRTTNSRWLQSFLSSNSKHDFCYTMANISPSHIQQCLNLMMHFLHRHLAAKMPSQPYNNFISFPYFLPFYETCSINVNPLFHAAIKNLHIKPNSIFLLLHPPLSTNNT